MIANVAPCLCFDFVVVVIVAEHMSTLKGAQNCGYSIENLLFNVSTSACVQVTGSLDLNRRRVLSF